MLRQPIDSISEPDMAGTLPIRPTSPLCNLGAALRRMGGNVSLLRQVIGFFDADAPEMQHRLRESLAANNGPAVQLAAHSLKGLVANFDAVRAVQAALRVEQLAKCGELGAAAVAADLLDRELSELAVSLHEESARLG